MKIVYCLVDSSRKGGMERIVSTKANYLTESFNHEVTIITTDRKGRKNFYPYSSRINFIDLEINYDEIDNLRPVQKLRLQLKKRKLHKIRLEEVLIKIKADIVISTYTHEYTLLPSIQDGSKKIAEVHFTKRNNQIENKYGSRSLIVKAITKISNDLLKPLYIRKYDKLVVLTKTDRIDRGDKNNITNIYNPLPFTCNSMADLREKKVLAAGRLVFQKGFDILIEAWKSVNESFPDWKLNILGEGEDYNKLAKLIKKFNLEDTVKIFPPTENIIDEYLNSSIYVMSSRYEGFGMVLVEAMSCGVPCVSFDCPYGPAEIIQDNIDGLLVENGNIEQLAEKIKVLISNPELRKEMGKKAKQNVLRFSPEIIMSAWDKLFHELKNK